jgi:hypothetical protein
MDRRADSKFPSSGPRKQMSRLHFGRVPGRPAIAPKPQPHPYFHARLHY